MSQLAIHPNEVWETPSWRNHVSGQVVGWVAASILLHGVVVGASRYWPADDAELLQEAVPHEIAVELTRYVPLQPQRVAAPPQPLAKPVRTEADGPKVTPAPSLAQATQATTRQEVFTEPDVRSAYLHNPAPAYPAQAQRLNWEGVVQLKVLVSPTGQAIEVLLHQSSGRRSLDDAALNTVKKWTFSPAKKGSTPVEAWVLVPIEFKLGS